MKELIESRTLAADGTISGRMLPTHWRMLRDRLGWSQARMAEACGVQRSAVASWEAGGSQTGPAARLRLYAALPAASCPGCGRETASPQELAECAAIDRLTRAAHAGGVPLGHAAFARRRKLLADVLAARWVGGRLLWEVRG